MTPDQPEPGSGGLKAPRTAASVRAAALEMLELQRQPAALWAVWDIAPSSASAVGARFYKPRREACPLIVYFHGGGFVIDGTAHDAPLRDLAAATDCTIVAPNVRLAPEHQFPAALNDARQFARWICDIARSDPGVWPTIGIAGDSSGGNLAATVTRELTREGYEIGFQVLVYPMLDATAQSSSYREFATGYGFTHAKSRWYYDQYLPPRSNLRDPLVSPIFAADLEGLPPTLVVTAECDPLRDDGESYAQMIRGADGRATVKRYAGMRHGFFQMTTLAAARQAQRDISKWIHDESVAGDCFALSPAVPPEAA